MNIAELQRKLIQAARQEPRSEAVPYAFEKRVIALLRPLPTPDCWGQWAGALWRAAVPCVVVTLALSGWLAWQTAPSPVSDLSQEIDNTVLAVIDQEQSAELPE
jgi:hypothetical protein